jgi:methyl-accepting chemotaxis protein
MTDQPTGGAERRRKLVIINRALQGRLVGLLALLVVISSAFAVIVGAVIGPKLGPQNFISLLILLLLITLFVLMGVVYIGLRFSQRIAGPIYHFGRQLTDIFQGDYTRALIFRKNDEFQNLAGAFNHAMASLRDRVQEDISFCDGLAGSIEELTTIEPGKRDDLVRSIKEYRAKKERHIKGS